MFPNILSSSFHQQPAFLSRKCNIKGMKALELEIETRESQGGCEHGEFWSGRCGVRENMLVISLLSSTLFTIRVLELY